MICHLECSAFSPGANSRPRPTRPACRRFGSRETSLEDAMMVPWSDTHTHPHLIHMRPYFIACMHACMHAFIHAYIHAYIPACMYTYLIIFDIFVCMHAADICRCIDLRPCKTTVYWKFYCCFSVSACGLNRLVAPIARRSSTMFNPTRDKNLTVHGVTWTNHDKSIQTPSN